MLKAVSDAINGVFKEIRDNGISVAGEGGKQHGEGSGIAAYAMVSRCPHITNRSTCMNIFQYLIETKYMPL